MLSIDAPKLPAVEVGDLVEFRLYAFGRNRRAVGVVAPTVNQVQVGGGMEAIDHAIANVITIDYEVQLPPVEEVDPIYQDHYPAEGLYKGQVQLPADEVRPVVVQLDPNKTRIQRSAPTLNGVQALVARLSEAEQAALLQQLQQTLQAEQVSFLVGDKVDPPGTKKGSDASGWLTIRDLEKTKIYKNKKGVAKSKTTTYVEYWYSWEAEGKHHSRYIASHPEGGRIRDAHRQQMLDRLEEMLSQQQGWNKIVDALSIRERKRVR